MKTNYSRHKSKEQRNHRVKIYLTLLVFLVSSKLIYINRKMKKRKRRTLSMWLKMLKI